MNFGYTAHHQGREPLPLDPEDESHRYPLQLYHHVARSIDWEGRDVLEVSSGRGGGANFIMRYFKTEILHGCGFLDPRHRILPQALRSSGFENSVMEMLRRSIFRTIPSTS